MMRITEMESIVYEGIEFSKGMRVLIKGEHRPHIDKIRGCFIDEEGEPCLSLTVLSHVRCEDVISVAD